MGRGGANQQPQGEQQQGDNRMPPEDVKPPQDNQAQGNGQMPPGNMEPPRGNQQQGDGQMPPGNMQDYGDMPDRDVMMQAMKIMQSANGKELTDEQLKELKELGMTEEQISFVKNMPFGNGGMREGGFPAQNGKNGVEDKNRPNVAQMSGEDILVLGICIIFITAGLIFVIKFKRRKSS